MARNRQNLNIIYISDRMRETLRPIASCALTAVVAPMGYGKTTAVRWFLAEQAKAGAVVLQASIYSDNRSIFWKSVQKAFAAAGLTVLEGYDCPADASGAALLLEDLCAALGGKTPYYLFLDDFHLLGDERVAQFLCRLAYRLPENVHLIVASRNRFLPGEQVVRLGRLLHRIEADGLRLNREELLAYTHRCGVEITAAQAESLLRSCEGCLCMGADVTIAQGLHIIEPDSVNFSFIGDSTFFASGITGVVNAVYNQTDIVLVVLDNSTTAMTGHQPHPGTGRTMMGEIVEKISIRKILEGIGVARIVEADPLIQIFHL